MALRRTRPPQPLAPHGIPGHLVEFVEALRGQGISVGPSETVDAGRVMSVLGLGNREVLREGIACAVLRRPDHRDTYDALFELWFPAALGARTAPPDGPTGMPWARSASTNPTRWPGMPCGARAVISSASAPRWHAPGRTGA